MQSNPWFVRQSNPGRRFRLYCFPYAGGNAANYMEWQAKFDPAVEICAVQLPGRGARITEKPCRTMHALIEDLSSSVNRESNIPFAFFGHSLGALLAFELARHRHRNGLSMPARLIVSGCDAPQHRPESQRLHQLSDHALIDVLRSYNGTPPEVLEHQELMSLLLPTIRADFCLAEEYKYRAGASLDLPIDVMRGTGDVHCSLESSEGWRQETTGPTDIHSFDGDHFFIQSCRQDVLNRLFEILSASGYPAGRQAPALNIDTGPTP